MRPKPLALPPVLPELGRTAARGQFLLAGRRKTDVLNFVMSAGTKSYGPKQESEQGLRDRETARKGQAHTRPAGVRVGKLVHDLPDHVLGTKN